MFFSCHFTSICKACSYARIWGAKDYTDQAKLSADEILRLGAGSYTTTSLLLPASEILTAECPSTGHMKKFSLLLWSEVSFLLLRMTLKLSAGGGWEFQLPGCHHSTTTTQPPRTSRVTLPLPHPVMDSQGIYY